MPILQNSKGNGTSPGSMESRGRRGWEKEARRNGGTNPRDQTTESSGHGDHGHRSHAILGKRRVGFLGGPVTPQPKASQICGISGKKRKNEEPSAGTLSKKTGEFPRGIRPIIEMIIHHEQRKYKIRALLDTGCSLMLINQETVK